MKLTKSQLRQIIKEELQREFLTDDEMQERDGRLARQVERALESASTSGQFRYLNLLKIALAADLEAEARAIKGIAAIHDLLDDIPEDVYDEIEHRTLASIKGMFGEEMYHRVRDSLAGIGV